MLFCITELLDCCNICEFIGQTCVGCMLLPATKLLDGCTCEFIGHICDAEVCMLFCTTCVNGLLLPATKLLDVDCICEIIGHIWDVDVGEREPGKKGNIFVCKALSYIAMS